MLLSYQFSTIESIKLNQQFNNQTAQLVVTELYANTLWGIISSKTIRIDVVDEITNKKIAKNRWNSDTLKLAELKKREHQPSFFQRWGKLIAVALTVIAVLAFVFGQTVLEHKELEKNAQENFAKAYDQNLQKEWIASLKSGDFILCNKTYDEPAQVFKIVNLTDTTVVLQAFEQFIPMGEYEELDKLNSLTLGNTSSNELIVKRKYFTKGILEEITDNSGLNNKYIKQIQKK